MLALVDVHYSGAGARAACLLAEEWTSAAASDEWTVDIDGVAPYRPGHFFERELPCLVAALSRVTIPLEAIVVDGYVELDAQGRAGLGAHLHDHIGGKIPIVGIAKHSFAGSEFASRVLRGSSQNPLFVTARGMTQDVAANRVRGMHGEHRIPTLCTQVDHLCRGLRAPREHARRSENEK